MRESDILRGGRRWNPWRYLSRNHPHMKVNCRYPLPGTRAGLLTVHGIYLDCRLNQAGRRCTLQHEIEHLERGPVPDHPHFAALEEHIVDVLAARRLIALPHLFDALLWTKHPIELADELFVDLDTLSTRLEHLTPRERGYINLELARRQPWNN
ncbi:hypothetical protein HFP48_04595 [Rhodococcus sp. DMU1]|nr:hypothetical protein HFP48_04595 [Rhodococcus sp. DMU1]